MKYKTLLSVVAATSLIGGCVHKAPKHNVTQPSLQETINNACDKVKENKDNIHNKAVNDSEALGFRLYNPIEGISQISCYYIGDSVFEVGINVSLFGPPEWVARDSNYDGTIDEIFLGRVNNRLVTSYEVKSLDRGIDESDIWANGILEDYINKN